LNAKYKNLKSSNDKEITINVEFIINVDKKIEKVRIINNPLKITDKQTLNEFQNDMVKIIEALPKVKPLVFLKKPVKTVASIDIYM
jgi:hypothetical protein